MSFLKNVTSYSGLNALLQPKNPEHKAKIIIGLFGGRYVKLKDADGHTHIVCLNKLLTKAKDLSQDSSNPVEKEKTFTDLKRLDEEGTKKLSGNFFKKLLTAIKRRFGDRSFDAKKKLELFTANLPKVIVQTPADSTKPVVQTPNTPQGAQTKTSQEEGSKESPKPGSNDASTAVPSPLTTNIPVQTADNEIIIENGAGAPADETANPSSATPDNIQQLQTSSTPPKELIQEAQGDEEESIATSDDESHSTSTGSDNAAASESDGEHDTLDHDFTNSKDSTADTTTKKDKPSTSSSSEKEEDLDDNLETDPSLADKPVSNTVNPAPSTPSTLTTDGQSASDESNDETLDGDLSPLRQQDSSLSDEDTQAAEALQQIAKEEKAGSLTLSPIASPIPSASSKHQSSDDELANFTTGKEHATTENDDEHSEGADELASPRKTVENSTPSLSSSTTHDDTNTSAEQLAARLLASATTSQSADTSQPADGSDADDIFSLFDSDVGTEDEFTVDNTNESAPTGTHADSSVKPSADEVLFEAVEDSSSDESDREVETHTPLTAPANETHADVQPTSSSPIPEPSELLDQTTAQAAPIVLSTPPRDDLSDSDSSDDSNLDESNREVEPHTTLSPAADETHVDVPPPSSPIPEPSETLNQTTGHAAPIALSSSPRDDSSSSDSDSDSTDSSSSSSSDNDDDLDTTLPKADPVPHENSVATSPLSSPIPAPSSPDLFDQDQLPDLSVDRRDSPRHESSSSSAPSSSNSLSDTSSGSLVSFDFPHEKVQKLVNDVQQASLQTAPSEKLISNISKWIQYLVKTEFVDISADVTDKSSTDLSEVFIKALRLKFLSIKNHNLETNDGSLTTPYYHTKAEIKAIPSIEQGEKPVWCVTDSVGATPKNPSKSLMIVTPAGTKLAVLNIRFYNHKMMIAELEEMGFVGLLNQKKNLSKRVSQKDLKKFQAFS